MIEAKISRNQRDLILKGSPMTVLTDSICLSLAVIREVSAQTERDMTEVMDAYIKAMRESADDEIEVAFDG